MGLQKSTILGISITTDPKEKILEYIRKYLKKSSQFTVHREPKTPKPLVIVTPNPEQIVYAQNDKRFSKLLNGADVAIPDGVGLVLASKFFKLSTINYPLSTIPKRIPGVELMEDLVAVSAREGFPIGLIGGRGGLAVKAFECLQARYPGLKGWAEDGPEVEIECQSVKVSTYQRKNADTWTQDILTQSENINSDTQKYFLQLASRIQETKIRILFVGLGAPKQEYFMEELSKWLIVDSSQKKKDLTVNREQFTIHPLVLMSVGGSFDIIAGKIPRAPLALRALGFEWLWRLVREPWRWRRQLALLRFIRLVLAAKFL